MVPIIATPGAGNANSYITTVEANTYFASRLPLVPPWEDADDQTAALAMATRVLNAMAVPHKTLKMMNGEQYYVTGRQWTGTPASTTQALAWPRVGMFDGNGNPIPSTDIPQALKDAQAELAGQLVIADTTLDNEISVKGITSVRAGSVAITFSEMIASHVLPDFVWALMPSSWFTDELYTSARLALFDVVS